MHIERSFIEGLIKICEEEGNSSTIQNLRNMAFAKLCENLGKEMISANVNGKGYNYNIYMSADKLISAASAAISEYETGSNNDYLAQFQYV